MRGLTLVAACACLFLAQPVRAQEKNPYVRKGPIGASGETVAIDRSAMPPSKRSRALKSWVGKKVLFMPHRRGTPTDGKIGTIVSVGPEEYPNVIVEVEGKRFQRTGSAGTDESPRIEGLLLIQEIDSLRKQLIGKRLIAVGSPLYTYDPQTDSYGNVVIAERQQVKVVDVVSSWAPNTTSPFRVIVRTESGAEGFYDLDKNNLDQFFVTPEPRQPTVSARKGPAKPAPTEVAPVGELQLLESDGTTTEVSTEIVGLIRNNTSRTYSYVQVSFRVYDKLGNQVGSALANVNGLEAGGVWKFKAVCICRGSRFKLNKITGF